MSLHLGQFLHLGLRQTRTSRPTRACFRSPEIPKKVTPVLQAKCSPKCRFILHIEI